MSHEKQKELFNRLVKERALVFSDIKHKIDPNNLVYIFKTDGNEQKDFGNYQMQLKEILKNQARLKSNLSEIKTGGKKSPNQKNTIKNITNFFDLQEKIIDFFRDYSFLLSEAKY